MLGALWLIPALPFAGFLVLTLLGRRLGPGLSGAVGTAAVGLSALFNLLVAGSFLLAPPAAGTLSVTLGSWMRVGHFAPEITLYLDPLSLLMTVVITFVGFLIHLYANEYMRGEEGVSRFFAYMNLFVGAMLTLVLAEDFLLLLLGWEGVGLCSYLLIGFWYKKPENGAAARKAFLVTRVGDTALAVALFLIFTNLGTLHIPTVLAEASQLWPAGSGLAVLVALLLLGGAAGKSAQLPLQTWLPDAMAGPTPVSALIHAATMVTAGFYLVARTHALFELAPVAQAATAWMGAGTLLLAGFSALAQRDIKRVLAYSTISQIGYMFLALGVGAYTAATFHFMTHAFFKALLFLGAGAIIVYLHHEQDMFRMGGLRRRLPVTFWTFLVGAASLVAFPVVTSGFYSKDMILFSVWSSAAGGPVLWMLSLLGAFVTALYTARMVFLTFFGPERTRPTGRPRWTMRVPLVVLAALATLAGFVQTPEVLFDVHALSDFLSGAMPRDVPVLPGRHVGHSTELVLMLASGLTVVTGILMAYGLFGRGRAADRAPRPLARLAATGFGFDWLYDRLFVRPIMWLARVGKHDIADGALMGLARLVQLLHRAVRVTQTGRVRHYLAGVALGAILLLAVVVLA